MPVRLSKGDVKLVLAVGPDVVPTIQYAVTHTAAPVWAVGATSDSQQVLAVIRAGAREFLDQSRLRDDVLRALDRLRTQGGSSTHGGRTIGVAGAVPGVGVTTTAAGLAFALADKHPGETALLETGSGLPRLALDLDLDPLHSVADLAREWQRMDPTLLRQTLLPHPAGVQVLAHRPETLHAEVLQGAALRQALIGLRAMFAFTVVDLGHEVSGVQEAAGIADAVVVVVGLDVPAIRLTRQFLRELSEHGVPSDKIRLVANRHGQRKQVDWKKAQETLELPIVGWIPDDSATVNQALNEGQPLVRTARRAAITRSLDELAALLDGQPAPRSARAGV
jgi:pilus assembly protein CpaE